MEKLRRLFPRKEKPSPSPLQDKKEKPQAIVELGQAFRPLTGISEIEFQKLVKHGEDINLKMFGLEGVGKIDISLDIQFSDESGNPMMIDSYPDGVPQLRSLPTELYELAVSIDYDDSSTVDPRLTCNVEVGGLEFKGDNLEEEDPVRAGFAIFYKWQMGDKSTTSLLIPSEYLPGMKFTFTKSTS